MKRLLFIVSCISVATLTFGQKRIGPFSASLTEANRLSIVKSSISIPAWHEKSFWPLYEEYLGQANELSTSCHGALTDLAKMSNDSEDDEAFECGRKMLASRSDALKLLEKYYREVGAGFNGIIALEFLQAESVLDMMENTQIYEGTDWKKYRFYSTAQFTPQLRQTKHNIIRSAVVLPADKAQAFWEIYFRYEEECNALLGENYSIISLYSIEPSDFTPGLSKRLGYDFIKLMQRENKLKEEYFLAMNQAVGPQLASRFLAWEDYFSLVSKMYAWAEN